MLFVFSVSVRADANCLSQAVTEEERVYCEIVNRGEGRGLPSLEDFKRNDVRVQRLLLKRPAEKLKIALPKKPQVIENASIPRAPKLDQETNKTHAEDISSLANPEIALKECQITPDQIVCGHRHFQMKTNLPNRLLKSGVLEEAYGMNLPPYSKDKSDNKLEAQYYLSDVYPIYIQKMLDIGLGASTMSYTRFYHTFFDLQAQGVSFSDRFETMYRYLKKDKKTMLVKPVLSDQRPTTISQCDDIDQRIIVCDSGSANWVYVHADKK